MQCGCGIRIQNIFTTVMIACEHNSERGRFMTEQTKEAFMKYLKIISNLLLALLVVLVAIFIVPKVLRFFMPFVVGFIISLIVNPIVKFLDKKLRIKRNVGLLFLTAAVVGAVTFGCYALGTMLVVETKEFIAEIPAMYQATKQELSAFTQQMQHMLVMLPGMQEFDFAALESSVTAFVTQTVDGLFTAETFSKIGNIADLLVSVIMGILATYFFVVDRDKMVYAIRAHLPNGFYDNVIKVYGEILRSIIGYFKAQFQIMGVIFIIVAAGLFILDIKRAWLIALGIAVLDLLPVFGTGTVLIPWAVIKVFSGDFAIALGMLLIYVIALVVHQMLQPKLVGDAIGLNVFATLIYMYIGYKVQGVIGMMIAVPIGMVLESFYRAGAFDRLIWCVKELGRGIVSFCHIDKDVVKRERK